MNPATIERGVAAKADSRFYTGGPALPAYESPFARSQQTDLLGSQGPRISVIGKRRSFLGYLEFAPARRAWKYAKVGYVSGSHIETTGRASHQVLDLVGELAAQPRPSSAVLGQSVENTNYRDSGRDDASSFLSESGGRIRFSDIAVSSDEDLIEAGYLYFSHAEDPELAAESRRSFLKRIGLGPA